jgi:hypothetical protein
MKTFNHCGVCLGFLLAATAAFATPTVVNTNLQLRLVLDTPTSSTTVRIAKDPRNNQLYYMKINGDIYQVNLTNSTSTRVYNSTDHGLNGSEEGLAIGPDGTMYVQGDFNTSDGKHAYTIIKKGVPNNSGVRVWSQLAQTDNWQKSGGAYDHNDSALIVSPDGQTLFMNAGSRTDHGEVESNGGTFPDLRDVALTAKIFQLPASGANLFLTNDLPTLLNEGYVFVQGTRNAFDFAYGPNGDMFATENGPDRDMSDSLYWLRQGCHYGFPWRMGGADNPQQFPNYNPTNDPLLNPIFGAVSGGLYHNDPTFPPPPTNFTDPIINYGPSADIYRNPTNGAFINAGTTGTSLESFTAHSSPLGLVFDNAGAMAPPFQYHGFVLRWTPGDPTGDTVAGPFYDASQDLLDLNMTKLGTTNYQMYATTIVRGFSNPIDSEIISNKIYVVEYGGNQGLWEITFPSAPGPAPAPVIVNVSLSGANVIIQATNGVANRTYYTFKSPNSSLPLAQWTSVETNVLGATLNATGSFTVTVTNGFNPANPSEFFILSTP